ncbi:MAG: glucose-1-phosphate thymidylyltransferase RfbA [Candidatus Omnitrophica bacterium]|nr:glucose-1-phosphate thymidylyltransferase RfbA [Candidatus Omnitrophota bacterium]
MKGIILAGGKATRLYPITKGVCKQMLPIYDKPMIYYPLSVLMLAGIKDILIISTPKDLPRFKDLLGDGRSLGIKLSYAVQAEPKGIAQSLIIAEDFIKRDSVCLILGDNIFYGYNLSELLHKSAGIKDGAVIFGYYVKDPKRYGVLGLDRKRRVISIEEKPKKPKSNWVVSGIYFYDNKAVAIAKSIKPSARGELEITSVNNAYIKKGKLKVEFLSRGHAWLDTGTYESLIDASVFIKTIEDRQGLKIGCIEEVAYRMGYINKAQLLKLASLIPTSYGQYLKDLFKDE